MSSPLPFPELPYPAAPGWCFPACELAVFTLFVLCLLHARKRGAATVAYLLGGLAFGLLLETFEVMGDSYTYGHFWVMLGRVPVPVWVGCAWASIFYSSRLFSDAVGLPLFAAASFDTLLALNIDISIDAVAYRLHMWHWDWTHNGGNALTSQWFGIPYGNFVGWITVVFCYSAFSRLLEGRMLKSRATVPRSALVAALALAGSLGVLIFTEEALFPVLNHALGFTSGWRLMLLTVLLVMATVLGWRRKGMRTQPVGGLALWVPGWFHVYFVSCFFVLGFYRENPWMTAAATVNLALGLAIHFYPKAMAARWTQAGLPVSAPVSFAEVEEP